LKRSTTRQCALLVAVLLIGTARELSASDYSFTPLGFPPGETFPAGPFQTNALGISADGTAVVGFFDNTDPYQHAFRWTSSRGMSYLSGLEKGDSVAYGLSADGSVVVARHDGAAIRWTDINGTEVLGDGEARGVSPDGSIVVGIGSDQQAFRWTQANGMIPLGDLEGGSLRSSARRISANGLVVVGFGNSNLGQEAMRWTEAAGMVGLGDLPGGAFQSEALGVSSDGSVVVGYSQSSLGREAFRWTADEGMVGLGDLTGGGFASIAWAVSADGSVVVGSGTEAVSSAAFIWTQSRGMENLQDLLQRGGASGLSGWSLLRATDVSANGRTIAGLGINPEGSTEPWIATIPAIPEPSTGALAACALLWGAMFARKQCGVLRAPGVWWLSNCAAT